MKIAVEDISGDATTIKHKQPDLSSQEIMRFRSQDSVQNHQRPPSPQHTRSLGSDLRPGNEQEQRNSAVEMYDDAGPLESAPGTSLSPENQHLVEKDFAPESSTNFNL